MPAPKKKIAFHTLGCKLNFAETSTIARSVPPELFTRVNPDEEADIYVINTCSVTDAADRKCRQAIKKFIHRSPGAFIAVVGCYAQLQPQDIANIPGVDLVLGSNEKFDISKFLTELSKKKRPEVHSEIISGEDPFHTSWSMGDRTRSFLKIQDGCDYGCSYCTIPMARGKSRNPSISIIADEARKIAENGIREIVLTGVNTGDFGKTTGESFTDLLGRLVETDGIERIRLSSVEPNLLTDELIGFVSENRKMLPHFHIPLQSGSDRILRLMRRRYRRELFADRVYRIKESMPLAGIGADIIAGFPGETDEDFEDAAGFIDSLPVTYLHVFPYSERPGTPAESMDPKVDPGIRDKRRKVLSKIGEIKHMEFQNINTGTENEVLFEKEKYHGLLSGFTGNYLRVESPWQTGLSGRIAKVRLTGISGSGNMSAELAD